MPKNVNLSSHSFVCRCCQNTYIILGYQKIEFKTSNEKYQMPSTFPVCVMSQKVEALGLDFFFFKLAAKHRKICLNILHVRSFSWKILLCKIYYVKKNRAQVSLKIRNYSIH